MANDTVCIATLLRPHGVKGGCKARLETGEDRIPDELESVWLVDVAGRRFPATLLLLEFTQPGMATVYLEGHTSREAAALLQGMELHISAAELLGTDQRTSTDLPALKDYQLVDVTEGPIGRIAEVIDRPLQPLLLVVCERKGYVGTEIWVPWHPDLVVSQDPTLQQVVLALPRGLLSVYLEPDSTPDA